MSWGGACRDLRVHKEKDWDPPLIAQVTSEMSRTTGGWIITRGRPETPSTVDLSGSKNRV